MILCYDNCRFSVDYIEMRRCRCLGCSELLRILGIKTVICCVP